MGASTLSLWKRKHTGSVDDCRLSYPKDIASSASDIYHRRTLNHRGYILSRACIKVRCKDCIACRIREKCDPFSGKVMSVNHQTYKSNITHCDNDDRIVFLESVITSRGRIACGFLKFFGDKFSLVSKRHAVPQIVACNESQALLAVRQTQNNKTSNGR